MRPIDETYADVEKLIWSVVHRFADRHGWRGDREELRSVADETFMRAYRSYRADGAAFSTYLSAAIWNSLLDYLRRESRRPKSADDELLDAIPTRPEPIRSTVDLFAELGRDAATVARLTIDTPTEIARAIQTKGGKPRNVRSTIREYLRRSGWSAARVRKAFSAVADVV